MKLTRRKSASPTEPRRTDRGTRAISLIRSMSRSEHGAVGAPASPLGRRHAHLERAGNDPRLELPARPAIAAVELVQRLAVKGDLHPVRLRLACAPRGARGADHCACEHRAPFEQALRI